MVNRQNGQVNSVSILGHFASTVSVDEISDYRRPAEGDAEKIGVATKLAPLVNFPGEGFVQMTSAEWEAQVSGLPPSRTARGHRRVRSLPLASYGSGWKL
jgi:hypothetical protein